MNNYLVRLGAHVYTIRAADEAIARDIKSRLFPPGATFGTDGQTASDSPLNVAAYLASTLE